LKEWRSFVGHINSSNPFKELWDKLCEYNYSRTVKLQTDCPTRFSSTITMLRQAVAWKDVVEEIWKWTGTHEEFSKHHVGCFLIYYLL
jgi:hypothetical protein